MPPHDPSASSDRISPLPGGDLDPETGSSKLKLPKGWTRDEEAMCYDFYWKGDDDLKESLETDYGLSNVQPLATRDATFGGVMFLLESTDNKNPDPQTKTRYYAWNGTERELCQIKPSNLEQIYATIDKSDGYLGRLDLEVVKADWTEEEDEDED